MGSYKIGLRIIDCIRTALIGYHHSLSRERKERSIIKRHTDRADTSDDTTHTDPFRLCPLHVLIVEKEGRLNDGGGGLLLVLLDGDLAFLGETHLGGKGRVGLPAGRLARGAGLLHHAVDLLQRETLGFPHREVSVDEAEDAGRAPDEEDTRAEVALVGRDHVRSDDGDDAVPEPVGGGGESDTSRSDGNGEDLANDDPCTGTPSAGKEEDVDLIT